jgi:hypothetical protein
MSRGMGRTQRAILAALQAEPGRRFTVNELAAVAFPGIYIGPAQIESVRRALKTLGPKIGLHEVRVGQSNVGGWHYAYSTA